MISIISHLVFFFVTNSNSKRNSIKRSYLSQIPISVRVKLLLA